MENNLYNVEQIVKISKHEGGHKSYYKFIPAKYITLFGKKFKLSDDSYYFGSFSIKKENITENNEIFKGKDGAYYYNPYLKIKFTDGSSVEISFNTIEEMEEKFNWWKSNYPKLKEL